jgi:hypothetical protein
MDKNKITIGREVAVDFGEEVKNVPAKVDTGADGSAVWASGIFVDENHVLHFKLFGKSSPYYTGKEHMTKEYSVVVTKSSLGEERLKYKVKLSVRIAGRKIRASFGLSNRSTHNYPILIGLRTLKGKFIVDVSQTENLVKRPPKRSGIINEEMQKDPYKFYKEQYLKGGQK